MTRSPLDVKLTFDRNGLGLPADQSEKKITAKAGVDMVFEHVGKATWDESASSSGK